MSRRNETEGFDFWWSDLALYNAEVARGIMHTPEWKAKMAKKQEVYNDTYANHGFALVTGPIGPRA